MIMILDVERVIDYIDIKDLVHGAGFPWGMFSREVTEIMNNIYKNY